MVSAVIVLSRIYAFVNLHWTKHSTFVYYDFTTNGKGEWRGNGPLKAGTGRRKPQQVRVQDSWKPLGAERRTKHRKRGEVKTIRAKKPPIEALYPELPARRPNKG